MLNRLTYASTLSHLRRLNSPIGREGQYQIFSISYITYPLRLDSEDCVDLNREIGKTSAIA